FLGYVFDCCYLSTWQCLITRRYASSQTNRCIWRYCMPGPGNYCYFWVIFISSTPNEHNYANYAFLSDGNW
ncbi:hypothetical protein WUBG_13048, partial [Wuchereria bancrofti]